MLNELCIPDFWYCSLSLLIWIADCTQFLSENHMYGCQFSGQFGFFKPNPNRFSVFSTTLYDSCNCFSTMLLTNKQTLYDSCNCFSTMLLTNKQTLYDSCNCFPVMLLTNRQTLYDSCNRFSTMLLTNKQTLYNSCNRFSIMLLTNKQTLYDSCNCFPVMLLTNKLHWKQHLAGHCQSQAIITFILYDLYQWLSINVSNAACDERWQ